MYIYMYIYMYISITKMYIVYIILWVCILYIHIYILGIVASAISLRAVKPSAQGKDATALILSFCGPTSCSLRRVLVWEVHCCQVLLKSSRLSGHGWTVGEIHGPLSRPLAWSCDCLKVWACRGILPLNTQSPMLDNRFKDRWIGR